jgi:hypothetical protein
MNSHLALSWQTMFRNSVKVSSRISAYRKQNSRVSVEHERYADIPRCMDWLCKARYLALTVTDLTFSCGATSRIKCLLRPLQWTSEVWLRIFAIVAMVKLGHCPCYVRPHLWNWEMHLEKLSNTVHFCFIFVDVFISEIQLFKSDIQFRKTLYIMSNIVHLVLYL